MLLRRPVAVELRLRAQADARRQAQQRLQLLFVRFAVGALAVCGLFMAVATDVQNYLALRDAWLVEQQNPFLLAGFKQKRLNDSTLRNLFHRAVEDIGLKQKIVADVDSYLILVICRC